MDRDYSALELLRYANNFFSQDELADRLNRSPRTVRRWMTVGTGIPTELVPRLQSLLKSEGKPNLRQPLFKFIDLFAGIGGTRLGFEAHGGECVFTSEWDTHAAKTYRANFPNDSHVISGDIQQIDAKDIPDHNILVAGFPCQPFSIAGVSKKNSLGRKHGFEDETQGTLFYDVARIIQEKRPDAFLLENVKNLRSHDKGRTYQVIRNTLERELKYKIFDDVIDARYFVPQHRERIFIVGFRNHKTDFSFSDLMLPHRNNPKLHPRLGSILHPEDGSEPADEQFTFGSRAEVSDKYILTSHLWRYLRNYAAKHRAAGNGFGYSLVGANDVTRTLSARYHKDGSEILVFRGFRRNPRRLTPRECARLMGFDRNGHQHLIPVSDTQAYRQFGNSIVVPVVEEVARLMVPLVLEGMRLKKKRKGQLTLSM